MAQSGWWHNDEWHRLQWDNAEDDIGARCRLPTRLPTRLLACSPACMPVVQHHVRAAAAPIQVPAGRCLRCCDSAYCPCPRIPAGRGMMAAVRDANLLRSAYPALRYGWSNCIHEDRKNGVMG